MTAYTGEHEEYIDPSLDDYDIHKIEDKPINIGLSIDINKTCTDSHRSEEEFGEWSESYINMLSSVSITDHMPDIVTTLDVRAGDDVIVVWVEWSTGNSFGSAHCGSSEPIAVFKDYKSAAELESFLEASEYYDKIVSAWRITKYQAEKLISEVNQPHNVTYEFIPDEGTSHGKIKMYLHTSDGQSINFSYLPWTGYFDRLEHVNINETRISQLH